MQQSILHPFCQFKLKKEYISQLTSAALHAFNSKLPKAINSKAKLSRQCGENVKNGVGGGDSSTSAILSAVSCHLSINQSNASEREKTSMPSDPDDISLINAGYWEADVATRRGSEMSQLGSFPLLPSAAASATGNSSQVGPCKACFSRHTKGGWVTL